MIGKEEENKQDTAAVLVEAAADKPKPPPATLLNLPRAAPKQKHLSTNIVTDKSLIKDIIKE